ncbi:hypothetical protein PCLA_10f0314 [Pseudomonas citronellolis]|nr:hypothetical protein PCLA_10f0314 [Pseudomonas citronellolis]
MGEACAARRGAGKRGARRLGGPVFADRERGVCCAAWLWTFL